MNTIFKSSNGGTSWENLNIRLMYDKGTALLPIKNGLLIGSDGAYNCSIDIMFNDDHTHKNVYVGWANTVFAIRQSDITGMIYAFCKIDSSASNTSYFPPLSVLSLSAEERDKAINEWKKQVGDAMAKKWQDYHDSTCQDWPEDCIIPRHYAILVSRDGGLSFEPLVRYEGKAGEPYGFYTAGYFFNGECVAGRFHKGYSTIVISEGKHKYVSDGIDLSGEVFIRTNSSSIIKPLPHDVKND